MSGAQKTANPLVSIIVPTRNEAADIAMTLDACLALEYEPKEIIVVDDSTDNTPDIVRGYAERGVSLVHRERNENGCCGARNLGMRQARGEILVIMNADDRPAPDFLDRLLAHYRDGADYAIVRSVVQNLDNIWARYVWAAALEYFSTDPDMEWSEGFSCRRAAAEQVGYIPGDFPVPFCRDYLIGVALGRAGYRKHNALDIPMPHVAPGDLKTFWNNRVWRGTFPAPFNYYFHKKTLPALFLREVLKLGWRVLRYLTVIPAVWGAWTLARRTSLRDLPAFLWVGLVQDAAFTVGGFKGLRSLAAVIRSGKDRE